MVPVVDPYEEEILEHVNLEPNWHRSNSNWSIPYKSYTFRCEHEYHVFHSEYSTSEVLAIAIWLISHNLATVLGCFKNRLVCNKELRSINVFNLTQIYVPTHIELLSNPRRVIKH